MPEIISQNMGYIITAVAVIVGLVLAVMVVRAFGGRVSGRRGSRLAVSEYYEIDNERRLLLVRRDDREHLLLIGGNQDIVVESGIEVETDNEHRERLKRLSPRRQAVSRDDDDDDNRLVPIRPAPRPAVFGDRSPALRPVGREEPKLNSIPASGDDNDKS